MKPLVQKRRLVRPNGLVCVGWAGLAIQGVALRFHLWDRGINEGQCGFPGRAPACFPPQP